MAMKATTSLTIKVNSEAVQLIAVRCYCFIWFSINLWYSPRKSMSLDFLQRSMMRYLCPKLRPQLSSPKNLHQKNLRWYMIKAKQWSHLAAAGGRKFWMSAFIFFWPLTRVSNRQLKKQNQRFSPWEPLWLIWIGLFDPKMYLQFCWIWHC
jgi:hypothetical protein